MDKVGVECCRPRRAFVLWRFQISTFVFFFFFLLFFLIFFQFSPFFKNRQSIDQQSKTASARTPLRAGSMAMVPARVVAYIGVATEADSSDGGRRAVAPLSANGIFGWSFDWFRVPSTVGLLRKSASLWSKSQYPKAICLVAG